MLDVDVKFEGDGYCVSQSLASYEESRIKHYLQIERKRIGREHYGMDRDDIATCQ